ncbi:MAG: hypothetical protein ACUVUP_03640 [Thermaceae bacterium]
MVPFPLLFLVFVLLSCARQDAQPPQLALVEPPGGGVAPGKDILVRGYAFDSTGVRSVRVQGQEVLPPGEEGKRLVEFRFRLKAPTSGQVELHLEAEDARNLRRILKVPLTLDAQPPRIVLEKRGMQDGLLQVSGRIEDNVGVERVVLQEGGRYAALALPKGTSVPFGFKVKRGAVLIAVDAAGNRTSLPLR